MIGGIEETSASFEARSAPRSYPTSIKNSPAGKQPPFVMQMPFGGLVQFLGLKLIALTVAAMVARDQASRLIGTKDPRKISPGRWMRPCQRITSLHRWAN